MPDFSREEVERVAKGLSTAQESGVRRARPFDFGAWLLPVGTARGLAPVGVAVRTIDGMCLTPLGLAVRQHLIGTGEGGRDGR